MSHKIHRHRVPQGNPCGRSGNLKVPLPETSAQRIAERKRQAHYGIMKLVYPVMGFIGPCNKSEAWMKQ